MVEGRIDRRELHRQLRRLDVELLAEQHRQAGVDALAHLALADDHRDRVVAGDPQEGVRLELERRLAGRPGARTGAAGPLPEVLRHHVDARGRCRADHAEADQEVAAAGVDAGEGLRPGAHAAPRLISAARFTAARMRG